MMGFGLLFLIVIAGVIAYALGWRPAFLTGNRPSAPSQPTPLDILKERYARGEISREEYEAMRSDLE